MHPHTQKLMKTAKLALFLPVLWSLSATADIVSPSLGALEAAASQGDPEAQTTLAVRYEHAEGVPRNYSKAIELYCKAAKQGDANTQFKLGWMYANGRGVSRDDGLALALFDLAAKQGHSFAQQMMGNMGETIQPKTPACLKPESAPMQNLALDSPAKKEIAKLVYQLAPTYSVDPVLALAIIAVESGFRINAVSPMQAQGLMQLIPSTAQRFHVKNVFDAADNIRGGLAYLQWLLAYFQGNISYVAAAYNAGEGAVEQYHGVPPYPETQSYVGKVTRMYPKTQHPYQEHITGPSPLVAKLEVALVAPGILPPATLVRPGTSQ